MTSYDATLAAFAGLVAASGPIDLASAALLVAAAEYPALDLVRELGNLDALAAGAARFIGEERDPLFCANTLSQFLFDEIGLRGNRDDYYDPSNSYLNRVLERRLGIPISLSLVYIEVGRRLGIPLEGIGMPGHFLVRHTGVMDLFIDPFHGGILLSPAECASRLQEVTGYDGAWRPEFLAPIGERDFLARMLRNLKGIYLQGQAHEQARRTMDFLVTLLPEVGVERRDRGLVHYQLGDHAAALTDLRAYVANEPGAGDGLIQELIDALTAQTDAVVGED
ncbi:MAG: tetratricopeptide repeat protein [Dehalococcoidia bacterium]|nr:tetratricopeptide repeat protein [Dehalococcoidia bacterium]